MRTIAGAQRVTIRSLESKNGRLYFDALINDAARTDTFKSRFRWTEDCVTRTGEVALLWNHDSNAVAGRTTLYRDGDDLGARGWVWDKAVTPYGVPIRDIIADGVVDTWSFRFDNEAKYERGGDFDLITPNFLHEVTITPLPSNSGTGINSTTSRAVEAVLIELSKHEDMQVLTGAIRTVLEQQGESDDGTRAWSAPRLKDFTSKSWPDLTDAEKNHIKGYFLYAPDDASKFGDLKLPYKDPETGKASLDGLKAAASRLPNTDIPEADKKTIGSKIASEMSKLGSEYTGEYAPDRALDMRPVDARGAGPLDFGTLRDRLDDAVEDAWEASHETEPGGWTPWCTQWVSFVYDDFCIIYDYSEAAWYKAPYSVDSNGIVTLGAYQLVLMDWVVVQGNSENEPEPPEPAEAPRAITKEELLERICAGGDGVVGVGSSADPVADVFRRALSQEGEHA